MEGDVGGEQVTKEQDDESDFCEGDRQKGLRGKPVDIARQSKTFRLESCSQSLLSTRIEMLSSLIGDLSAPLAPSFKTSTSGARGGVSARIFRLSVENISYWVQSFLASSVPPDVC